MDKERATRQLQLIAETNEIAQSLGADVWLRGGWAMDFYLGELTRDHEDIDWFAWISDAAKLTTELLRRGYRPLPGPPTDQQLDFAKDELEASFALLNKDQAGQVVIAGGPWGGEPWPEAGMLHPRPGRLDGVQSKILSPRAQVEIKKMMPIWVPGRSRRQKDVDDIARIETALEHLSQRDTSP